MRQHRLSSAIRTTLAASIAVAAIAGSAHAQQAAAPAANDAQTLDAVKVTGYRASLEKSQAVKRAANAIVDAISAEDIGKFPDTNAAESLAHLPGISVDRQFGEGEKVSINGTDPALNRVLLNGQTIASGDWGGNPTDTSGRTFNYTLLSPEIIGLMEVYKSPEARIDEGSIGGTVIVHTRKPLELPANTVRGSLGYSYNDRSEQGNPRGSVLWSWKNSDDTFGVLASVTHDKQEIWRAGIEYWGYALGTNIPDDVNVTGSGDVKTARFPFGENSAFFQQERQRDGLQAALQWKPNDRNEFNLTGIYIKGKYNNFSESRYVCPGCSVGNFTDVTLSNGYITSGTVGGDAYAQFDANYRMSEVETKSLNLRHDYSGDKWVFTTQLGATSAKGGKDPEYLMKFLLQSGGYDFSYDGKRASVHYDDGSASNWGLVPGQQAGGIEYTTTDDREKYFQFDAERDLEWGAFNKLRVGYKYINHDNGQGSYGNRIDATDPILLTQFDPGTAPGGLYDGLNASGDLIGWPTASLASVLAYLKGQPQGAFEEKYGQEYDVKELTNDLYAQLDFEAGGWRGNLGLRYVSTMDKSLYWRDTDGAGYNLTLAKKQYYKPLPSFNLAYDLDEDKVVRFSAAKVIARPRYAELSGSVNLDTTTKTGGGGNPDLDPYEATNFGVSLEWYFAPSSVISAEAFYRKIDNYVVNTTNERVLTDPLSGEPTLYTLSSPVNAAGAKVNGLALTYAQNFGHGFGVQSNLTYTDTNTSEGLNLPYVSRITYNVIPYYENGPFSARINYSYRSEYFTQVGRLNSNVFTDAYKQLDFTAAYQIGDHMSVNFNANNLLDSTYYWYSQVKFAPLGTYKTGRSYQVSFNFKF